MGISIYKLASSLNKRVIPNEGKNGKYSEYIKAEAVPLSEDKDNLGKIKMIDTNRNISVIFPLQPVYDEKTHEQIAVKYDMENRQLLAPVPLDRLNHLDVEEYNKKIFGFVYLVTGMLSKAIKEKRFEYEKTLCKKMPAIAKYLNKYEDEILDKDSTGEKKNPYEYAYYFSVDYIDDAKKYPSSIRMTFDDFKYSEDNYVDFYLFYNDKDGHKIVGTAGVKHIIDKSIDKELLDKKIDMVKRIIISYSTNGAFDHDNK